MILVCTSTFTWANSYYLWRHGIPVLFVSLAPKYILGRITDTELIKQLLENSYYEHYYILLQISTLTPSRVDAFKLQCMGITKGEYLWPLNFSKKGCFFNLGLQWTWIFSPVRVPTNTCKTVFAFFAFSFTSSEEVKSALSLAVQSPFP